MTSPARLLDVSRPGLRLLPVPDNAPPYDDELPPGQLLRLVPPRPRSLTVVLDPVRAVPGSAPDEPPVEVWLAARRTPLSELPSAQQIARVYVQGLMEVLAGLRPVTQLRRDTTAELYGDLAATVARRGRSTGPRPTGRTVRSVHVQARSEGVAEVCATVQRAGKPVALALRLEGRDGRWLCTDLAGL